MNVETTSMQASGIIFYVFRSYGPKAIANLWRDPSAAAQLRARDIFETWLSGHTVGRSMTVPVVCEYRRHIDGLGALPRLRSCLEAQQKVGGFVVIDDFRRPFSRCTPEGRTALLEDLERFGEQFRDMRHTSDLATLSQVQRMSIISAVGPVKPLVRVRRTSRLSEEERRDQTSAATSASTKARQEASIKAASEIAAIGADLVSNDVAPTLRTIADAANDRGLTTARGTPWTESSVCRALKRLDARSGPGPEARDLEGAQ